MKRRLQCGGLQLRGEARGGVGRRGDDWDPAWGVLSLAHRSQGCGDPGLPGEAASGSPGLLKGGQGLWTGLKAGPPCSGAVPGRAPFQGSTAAARPPLGSTFPREVSATPQGRLRLTSSTDGPHKLFKTHDFSQRLLEETKPIDQACNFTDLNAWDEIR